MNNKINITKASFKELAGWHAGSGHAFLSTGKGNEIRHFDFYFHKSGDTHYLSMGSSKFVKLTPEQIKVLGAFAEEEITIS